jgi:hypothetical protein
MVNIVNKFVTIFAGLPDSCIVTNNQPERLITTVTSSSGQINLQMTHIQFAVTAKNCTIPSWHRDPSLRSGLLAKETGQVPGACVRYRLLTILPGR